MPYLRRWDPFNEMRRMMRSSWAPIWDEDWELPEPEDVGRRFSVDMYEEGDVVVVKADLPGVDSEDVDITVTEDSVTISAEKEEEIKEEKRNYLRRERRFGSFSRSLVLPAMVQPDKAKAEFESGTLTLRMPKVEEEKAKQVKVKVKSDTK